MEIIRKPSNGTTVQGFAPWIKYDGPEWSQESYPFNESSPVPPDEVTAAAGDANVPGLETGKSPNHIRSAQQSALVLFSFLGSQKELFILCIVLFNSHTFQRALTYSIYICMDGRLLLIFFIRWEPLM